MDRQLVRSKSELLLKLELAKLDRGRRQVFDLASQAAALEGRIARELIIEGRAADAVVNLISQASCFGDAGRMIEKRRVLEGALEIDHDSLASEWVRSELKEMVGQFESPARVFKQPDIHIEGNERLRRPQREAYAAAREHFLQDKRDQHVIIQLPVGCGKTGAIAVLPFGISTGRVLVVAPNLIIRSNLLKRLDSSGSQGFLREMGVLNGAPGPTCALLDENANVRDCDEAAIVVTNIQQLVSGSRGKWLSKLPSDFFDLIVMDEGHHNVASTWQQTLGSFPGAKVASFTATPFRADGQKVAGTRIYRFPIVDAIKEGYVKDVASRRIEPEELTFVYKGETMRHSLAEVVKLKEKDWFSKGVALSPECNRGIIDHSIQCLNELRAAGTVRHAIVAVACSIDHAKAVSAMYEERMLKSAVIHSDLPEDEQRDTLSRLERRELDAIVQVQMLGEGADFQHLSVAAIFRPFRHLVPYVQFVGRIMRVVKQDAPGDPDNRGYVVSHVGLNVDRWWTELKGMDESDQEFLENLAMSDRNFLLQSTPRSEDPTIRRRFTPDMIVLQETIARFVTERFLPEDIKAVADDVIQAMRLRGLDLTALGVSREQLEDGIRNTMAESLGSGSVREQPVQPQRARQAARKRLDERIRSASKQLLNELKMAVVGRDLPMLFPQTGATNNIAAAIILLNLQVQEFLGLGPSERDIASTEQLVRAHDQIDHVIDAVAAKVRQKKEA